MQSLDDILLLPVRHDPPLLDHDKAVDYRLAAGRRAIARSAMAEALAQLARGMEILTGVTEGPERDRRELDLRIASGEALVATRGPAADETREAYGRARQLAERTENAPQLFRALWGQFQVQFSRAELTAALATGERFLELAELRKDLARRSDGHRLIGTALLHLGQLSLALSELKRRKLQLKDEIERLKIANVH